jgi:hypothetical protein
MMTEHDEIKHLRGQMRGIENDVGQMNANTLLLVLISAFSLMLSLIQIILFAVFMSQPATDETKPPQVIQTKQSDSAWMEAPST